MCLHIVSHLTHGFLCNENVLHCMSNVALSGQWYMFLFTVLVLSQEKMSFGSLQGVLGDDNVNITFLFFISLC